MKCSTSQTMTLRLEGDLSLLNDDGDCASQSTTSLQHLEFEDGTVPMVKKTGGSGRMSPVRARTMKEYEQQIAELQKENFSLKLRIYFLEERMKKEFDGNGEDIYKINIELQVEVESLKQDLMKKQELLKQASNALDSITAEHQVELQQARESAAEEVLRRAQYDAAVKEQSMNELRSQLMDADQQVHKFRAELEEANQKLMQLLTMNDMLDSHCQALESAKHELELQLESTMDSSSDVEQETDKIGISETELLEKEKLIEQLRCGLRAKDVIIEQLEEEKKELAQEAAQRYENRIGELTEKLKAIESSQSGNNGKYEICVTPDAGGICDADPLNSDSHDLDANDGRTNVMNLEQQLMELKSLLLNVEKEKQDLQKNLTEMELEVDRCDHQVSDIESTNNRLKLDLDAANAALDKKEKLLQEVEKAMETERQHNAENIAALNAEYKAMRDSMGKQAELHEHTVEQLLDILKQRDVNIHQYLTVTHQDLPAASVSRGSGNAESLADPGVVVGSRGSDYLSTVLAALQETMQKMANKDVEIKALHENHAAQIKQLTDEIAALRQRLHETDGKHQKSAVIRTTELCVTDVINELSNSPSQTEIFVETPSQTLNTVDEPDGLSGKPGSSVVSCVANVPNTAFSPSAGCGSANDYVDSVAGRNAAQPASKDAPSAADGEQLVSNDDVSRFVSGMRECDVQPPVELLGSSNAAGEHSASNEARDNIDQSKAGCGSGLLAEQARLQAVVAELKAVCKMITKVTSQAHQGIAYE